MSTIPSRAKLKSIHWAGRYTWILAGLIVVTAGVLIQTGIYNSLSLYLSIMLSFGLMTPLWLGTYLDRKARIKRMLTHFASIGFVSKEAYELDEELLDALEAMEPHSFETGSIRFATNGIIHDHEVVMFELFTEVDNHTTTFTGCAAWIADEFPLTTIRRRTLKDKLSKHPKLGNPKLDKQRVIKSQPPGALSQLLLEHADWFISNPSQLSSFRMGQPPGKVEQWAFHGHWAVLVDQGSAYTKHHIAMAEFLVAFAKELEAQELRPATHDAPAG